MIRGLKILGNFSLATLNRGLYENCPKVKPILDMLTESSEATVDYEDIYYKSLSKNSESIDFLNPKL